MAENTNIAKLGEVGLNKYGQRLDEFNEFGQSLEAEVWYFDGAPELPAVERIGRPTEEKKPTAADSFASLAEVHRRAA